MDQRLLSWARAVKQRRRGKLPVLWLFTDSARLPDPLPAIVRLPAGISGVVFRHDEAPDREGLGEKIAKLCKARRIALVVAGDCRLAMRLGAGVHLRGGHRTGLVRSHARLITASVHDMVELRRARRAGAHIAFISPVFPTASHPGQPALGALKWRNLARQAKPVKPYALGGVTGKTTFILTGFCHGVASISALDPKFNTNVT
jgi:thiamine-phosphate pyrophosphorylase